MVSTNDVFIYGFTSTEENYIKRMLPNQKSTLIPTDCFTDIIACNSYAIFIKVSAVSNDDLKMLWDYYIEVGATSETIILVGNADIPKQVKKKIQVYSNFEELQDNLKYILLSAYRSNTFSGSKTKEDFYGIL